MTLSTRNRRLLALGLVLGLGLGAASAAGAADWTLSAFTGDGLVYETDLDTVGRDGQLVRSWTRETRPKLLKDPASGRAYLTTTEERFDDCAARRYTLGSYIRRDAQGAVVASGTTLSAGWHDVAPGTIGQSLSRLACAVVSPPAAAPIQADPLEGSWTDLGASANGAYHLQVRIDNVIKLDHGMVAAVSRTIYAKPEWIEGLPVRMIVTGDEIDCAHGTSAGLAGDFYVSPKVRVMATRTADKDVHLEAAHAGSFLANGIKLICAAAAPPKAAENTGTEDDPEACPSAPPGA